MEIFLSAGDPSGDNASARLVEALRRRDSGLHLCGLGGSRLLGLGQEQFADGADLAVLGFWEVARRYQFFRKLMHRCVAQIQERRPDAVVLVDYPGFNLRLAERVRGLRIPIIYYISPQIWAWGQKRLRQIERLVDLMLVILPFEEEFYAGSQVKARFVGHYLLEDIPAEYQSSNSPDQTRGALALLPGSRPQEIERMLPAMLETARAFTRAHNGRAIVAAVSGAYDYERALERYRGERISVVYDDPRRVIYESALVLTASGTATLETAIIGRPMVVVYRTGNITYQIARRLITLDKIALVNLVAGKKIVPELIQGEANPQRMATELRRIREDSLYRGISEELRQVTGRLGGPGASDRAAALIVEQIGRK